MQKASAGYLKLYKLKHYVNYNNFNPLHLFKGSWGFI